MMNLLSSTFLKPTLTMRTLTFPITQPVMKLMSVISLVLKSNYLQLQHETCLWICAIEGLLKLHRA